jgi:hypothetical protein
MGRHIRIRAVRKEQPNIGLYVQALIALARELQERDGQRSAEGAQASSPGEARKGGES